MRIYLQPVSAETTKLATQLIRGRTKSEVIKTGNFLGFSPNHSISQSVALPALEQSERPDLFAAFDAVNKYPIQVCFIPPAYLWKTFDELMPTLPPQFGGGPTSDLTQGVRWSAIGIQPAGLKVLGVTQSSSPEAATQFELLMPKLLSGLADLLPKVKLAAIADPLKALLPMMNTEIEGDRLILKLEPASDGGDTAEVLNIADRLLSTLTKPQLGGKLKQIGLAIHNFESTYSSFPPAAKQRDVEGKSGLSWRVHILPFLGDEQLALWQKFHLDEPWNSDYNIKLLDEMPSIYNTADFSLLYRVQSVKPGYTTLVAPVGEGTIFGGTEAVTFANIQDGTSNTIMVVQVKPELAVPWTSPRDYDFDLKNAFAGLADQGDGTFMALIGDGSWTGIPLDIAKDLAVYLFTMNDGKIVRW